MHPYIKQNESHEPELTDRMEIERQKALDSSPIPLRAGFQYPAHDSFAEYCSTLPHRTAACCCWFLEKRHRSCTGHAAGAYLSSLVSHTDSTTTDNNQQSKHHPIKAGDEHMTIEQDTNAGGAPITNVRQESTELQWTTRLTIEM